MMLSKWLMLVFLISGVQGIRWRRRLDYSSVNERTMKTILESCYENDSLSNPIVILGGFNVLIDKRSLIRMDNSLDIDEAYEKPQLLTAAASKIIVTVDSPRKLFSDLMLLKKTRWWNPMTPLFIIDNSNRPCTDKSIIDNLLNTWDLSITNSIYICAKSRNTPVLYTMNRMANHAPYPWVVRFYDPRGAAYVFERVFDANSPCENLHDDKTKWLHEHRIKIMLLQHSDDFHWPTLDCRYILSPPSSIDHKLLYSVIRTMNARCRLDFVGEMNTVVDRFAERTADLFSRATIPDLFPNVIGNSSPHGRITIVAVVGLNREVTTSEKLSTLWTTPVLILAATVLTIFTIILIMKDNEWSTAILDVLRLVTYRPILTNNGNHPFRLYFTSMLIFITIGNGIFHGSIVTFSTQKERNSAVESIDELLKLGYEMYTPFEILEFAKRYCPRCEFEEVQPDACIQYVLNSTNRACIITEDYYDTYNSFSLNRVKETLEVFLLNFKFRYDWPLANRFNEMILRHVESGIIDHWKMEESAVLKHQAMKAERSSVQYKPIKLHELKFAFQLLALGLSLSIIVFFLELLVARISNVL